MSPRFVVGGRSDVGLHRHNNQDSMYAGPRLLAVADGIGGAAGGEVASRLTIEALVSLDTDLVADPAAALQVGAVAADLSIRDTATHDPLLDGMGTTLTAILATDDAVTLGHIGDSRAYRLRAGELVQLTRDHTLVQSLVDEGQITEEEALTHPRRSWIMRALDGRGQPELDITTLELQPGDRYLVCSDGLSSYVEVPAITAALATPDPQTAADRLLDLALRAGGPDNISCIVADPADSADPAAADQPAILGGAIAEPAPARPGEAAGAPGEATVPVPAIDDLTADGFTPGAGTEAEAGRRGIGRSLAVVVAIVVVLVAGAVIGLTIYVHHQWYVAGSDGKVAVYRGVQGQAAGHRLSSQHALTNLPVTALPQDERAQVSAGIKTSSLAAANTVVANLRSAACALVSPTPSPISTRTLRATPTPTPVWCAGTS
jgi:PPM family protein phosphatase